MTTSSESTTYIATAPFPPVGAGIYPSLPAAAHLGFYPGPGPYHDLYPSLRSRFDTLGYSAFIPEGTFKLEEARLEALRVWTKKNQEREEARLETEGELEGYIVSRARHEAELWEQSLIHLDLQRQIAAAVLVKAKDRTLDERLARKALADAERSEHERDITATSLKSKAHSEALRAAEEVELVKCQYKKVELENKKLSWEITLVEAMVDTAKSQKAKYDAEKAKADAERLKAEAETQFAHAQLEAAMSAPPPPAETKHMIVELEKMDPCVNNYPWEHSPDEGGFRCTGGKHFRSYADARAFLRR